MPQLPASAAATVRASKPAPAAIIRGHGSRPRMSVNRLGGGAWLVGFQAEAATDAGCGRPKRIASHPFSQRMIAVAAQAAKKTTALAPIVVKKTGREPIEENHSQS